MNDEWFVWLRDYLERMIGFARQRDLTGADLIAHIDHQRRYAIALRNVMWAKQGDDVLVKNRISEAHDSGWMYARLNNEQ